jgi:hypothetical protein
MAIGFKESAPSPVFLPTHEGNTNDTLTLGSDSRLSIYGLGKNTHDGGSGT